MSLPACSSGAAADESPAADETPDAGRALGFRLGHSCHRMLVWECTRIPASAAVILPEVLREAGYSEASRSPLVRELVHPREHSVVVVPRTGRLQIRVHYLTPLEAREAAALEVLRELSHWVERAQVASSDALVR